MSTYSKKMGRMPVSVRARVVIIWKNMYRLKKIQAILKEEGTIISKTSLSLLIIKFLSIGSVEDNITAQRPRKLSLEMINSGMTSNVELSARKLHNLLNG